MQLQLISSVSLMQKNTHYNQKNIRWSFYERLHICVFAPIHLAPYFVSVMHWHLLFINFLMIKALYIYIHRSLPAAMRKVRGKCFGELHCQSTRPQKRTMGPATFKKIFLENQPILPLAGNLRVS